MSKKIYLFSLVLLALAFVSCDETEEVSRYDNWRERNEMFIDSIANVYDTQADHGGLERFPMITDPGKFLYYKEVEAVKTDQLNEEKFGKRPSSSNASVSIYYKDVNILGDFIEGNYIGKNPVADIEGGTSNPMEGDTPVTTASISSGNNGLQEALQRMTVGDRWIIYIPWSYGYGSSDNTLASMNKVTFSVLGYSTLIFDVQLLDATPVSEPVVQN